MKFKNDSPYPEIKVEGPNIEYANLLLNDYAGEVSEVTAIMTYSYQSFTQNEEIHKILEQINMVEMKHMELLGETIKQLGLNPIYKKWKTNYVDYDTNLKSILKKNIESELLAIKNYTNDAQIIDDSYIKRLLYRIIEDEKIHVEVFKKLLDK